MCQRIFTLIPLFLMLFCFGCSEEHREIVVGNWKDAARGEQITFRDDGTVQIRSVVRGVEQTFEGRYRFVEPETITIGLNGPAAAAGKIQCKILRNSDQLTLINPRGKKTEYRRTDL